MAGRRKSAFPERAASNMRCAKSRVSGGSDSGAAISLRDGRPMGLGFGV